VLVELRASDNRRRRYAVKFNKLSRNIRIVERVAPNASTGGRTARRYARFNHDNNLILDVRSRYAQAVHRRRGPVHEVDPSRSDIRTEERAMCETVLRPHGWRRRR
jgi:hypothetical protein